MQNFAKTAAVAAMLWSAQAGAQIADIIGLASGASLFVLVVVVLAVLLVFSGVKTVPQGSQYTVERFGRFTKSLTPGLNFIVPFIDRVTHRVNMM